MKITVKDLTLMAMYLALFYILDVISNSLPLFKMPQGGTLGLGVIALLLASYHLGWKKSLVVTFGCVLLQFVSGQMYIYYPIQFLLDYGVAFPIYGLASLFPRYLGVIITNIVRYFCHVISGLVFFSGGVWNYETITFSLSYNAWYMIPTTIVSYVVIVLLVKKLKIKA